MGSTEWKALVSRAQKIEQACKANAEEIESLKEDLVSFKKSAGGGKTKKGKSLWDKLMEDENENENNGEDD